MVLLHRVRAADPAALDELLQKYWAPLMAYAARLLSAEGDAQDVVQEVFIRLWNRRALLVSTSAVRPLLYSIARNIAFNERRRRLVREQWVLASERTGLPGTPTPLQRTIEGELQSAMERAVGNLPPRRREAFVLVCLHDMSHREVADVMGISPQTVANQVSSAFAELRQALGLYLDEGRSDRR